MTCQTITRPAPTTKRKPRVGVDCDGVVADLFAIMLRAYADLFGKELDGLTTWDVSPHIPDGRVPEYWQHIGSMPVHDQLQPYPEAVAGIARLQEVADVHFVTSDLGSCRTWAADRDDWIHRTFGIGRKKVIHCDAKYAFHGAMLIDDKPDHIESWAREHELGCPVLFSQPYNEAHVFADDLRHRVVRSNDWNHVARLVERL